MFECTFQINGFNPAICQNKARELKTRGEQFDAMILADKWRKKFRKGSDHIYVIMRCPFKVIYAKNENEQYALVRYEHKHIHKVEFE